MRILARATDLCARDVGVFVRPNLGQGVGRGAWRRGRAGLIRRGGLVFLAAEDRKQKHARTNAAE